MREIAIAAGVRNRAIIDFLHLELNSRLDFCKILSTIYTDNNFYYLLLAIDEKYNDVCETILKESIISYIETVYKIDYLKKKIKNPLRESLAFNAYIKVLAVFDKVTDEEAIKKILNFNETFFVDSFIEFRLNPLKKHWDNLAELSSDNLSLFNSYTFIDLIRFLINTMDNSIYKIKVVCDKEHFSLYHMKDKNAKIQKVAECDDSYGLISNVLNSCPSYIDVYVNEMSENEAVSFLSNIYSNRLKIYMKNCNFR